MLRRWDRWVDEMMGYGVVGRIEMKECSAHGEFAEWDLLDRLTTSAGRRSTS